MAKLVAPEELACELSRLGIERTPEQLGPLATGSVISWIRGEVGVADYRDNRLIPVAVDVIASDPVISISRRCAVRLLNKYANESIPDCQDGKTDGETELLLVKALVIPSEVLRPHLDTRLSVEGRLQRSMLGLEWFRQPQRGLFGILQDPVELKAILPGARELCSSDLGEFEVVASDRNRFLVVQRSP